MRLYVANCTKQIQDFVFRVPGDPRIHHQEIPIGFQKQIWTDASIDVLESIIVHHEAYGLVAAKSLSRAKQFVGLCYSLDQPVNLDSILLAHEHNDVVLTSEGLEHRKKVAAASMQTRHDQHRSDVAADLLSLEFEIQEQPKTPADLPGFSEVIAVTKDGKPRPPRQRQRRA